MGRGLGSAQLIRSKTEMMELLDRLNILQDEGSIFCPPNISMTFFYKN